MEQDRQPDERDLDRDQVRQALEELGDPVVRLGTAGGERVDAEVEQDVEPDRNDPRQRMEPPQDELPAGDRDRVRLSVSQNGPSFQVRDSGYDLESRGARRRVNGGNA